LEGSNLSLSKIYKECLINRFIKKETFAEKKVYYLSWLTVIAVVVLTLLEINAVFPLLEIYSSKILMYVVYFSASLLIPLVLLSSILAFKFHKTSAGKKSVKILTRIGIFYAVVKIILVIFNSFNLF
jgi:hypothetical protein